MVLSLVIQKTLQKFLAKYILGFNNLQVSLWSGHVELQNLELNTEVVQVGHQSKS